jgi:hypothetical protein
MVEKRGACRVSVGGSEGKKPLGRSRHRCVENIKIDFQEGE